MMCAYARFSFEPVGQGLFYTGKIDDFNMVYDCGNQYGPKKIDHLISDYTKSLKNSKIDMLVASHLHWDHVCGFDSLMKQAKVKYVFLPYLLPIQRLLLAISDSTYANQSYYDFLADPVSYFVERGAEKVILVGDGKNDKDSERNKSNDNTSSDEEFENNSEELNDESIRLPDNDELTAVIRENDPQLLKGNYKTHISVKSHNGLVSLKQKWIFRFFSPPTKMNFKKFETCIMNTLPGTKSLDNNTLKNILANKTDRDKLERCYKNTFKRPNDTSLMLFHGPTKMASSFFYPSSSPANKPVSSIFNSCRDLYTHNAKLGWVLTGDVNFKKVSSAFLVHFSTYLDLMTHLLIPHHGSKGNWDSNIMNRIASPSHWFVSYGLGNSFRHPNSDVISDIVTNGNTVSLCNEAMRLDQCVYT
jgi:hypothetical protein